MPPARPGFTAGLRAGLPLLIAIWAPELLLQKGVLSLAPGNERLPAGIVAVAIAWRYRSTFGTIVAGLLALHLFDWMF